MTDLDNPTALQRIVEDEEQAQEMLEGLEDLPEDADKYEIRLEVLDEDLPAIREELEEMVGDGDQ